MKIYVYVFPQRGFTSAKANVSFDRLAFCIFVCIVHVQERVRSPRAVSRPCSRQLSHTLSLVPSCTHRYMHSHTRLAQLQNGKQQAVAGRFDKRKEKKRSGRGVKKGTSQALSQPLNTTPTPMQRQLQDCVNGKSTQTAFMCNYQPITVEKLLYLRVFPMLKVHSQHTPLQYPPGGIAAGGAGPLSQLLPVLPWELQLWQQLFLKWKLVVAIEAWRCAYIQCQWKYFLR